MPCKHVRHCAPASRHRLRLVAVVTAGTALTIGTALPAAAHVTVNPGTTSGGGWAKVTFRVPTESATASTVELTVTLPTDHPLASVSLKPKPGWTATTATAELPSPVQVDGTTLTKAIHTITWKAVDGGIRPGEFDEFDASVGPLPDSGTLVFTAAQTYSDGTVVNWNETTPNADHPAPTLTIGGPSDDVGSGDGSTRGLSIAAVIVALMAVALAARKPRRDRGTTS
jgi:uncharacterized protein YcnI